MRDPFMHMSAAIAARFATTREIPSALRLSRRSRVQLSSVLYVATHRPSDDARLSLEPPPLVAHVAGPGGGSFLALIEDERCAYGYIYADYTDGTYVIPLALPGAPE